jgi:hypothetical protein
MSYPPQYGSQPAPPKKKTSPWLIGCLVVVGLGVVGFAGCAVLVGFAADKAVHYSPTPAAPVVTAKGSGHGAKTSKVAGIGDPVKDGKFTFTVTKVTPGPHTIGDADLGKTAQGKYLFVYVTVANHGSEAQTFSGDEQKLLSGGREYSADTEAAVYLPDAESLWTDINPGNTVKGIIIFDVPKSATPTAIVLHDSFFSGGVKVALK